MSYKQQTAVEFLQEALEIHFTFGQKIQFEGLFQQAKEMEKQQIIYAKMPKNLFGQIDQQEAMNEAEQYFNETFKKE